tara:strand:- start:371 stop:625 length:255 start_codon:yes stop_codon:yes gene_type:complete
MSEAQISIALDRIKELEREMIQLSAHFDLSSKELGVQLTIKDTEFLIRTLGSMSINAQDIEVFTNVMDKIQTIHKILLEKGVNI